MAAQAKAAKWLDRYPITDANHVSDLEQRAAVHEFGGKMPRHAAEERAYHDYRRDQVVEATAHHLAGMRAAHAAGLTKEAARHATMYVLGLRALGHSNAISPPDEVASKALHTPPEVYRFKTHPADSFSLTQLSKVEEFKKAFYSWHLGGGDMGTMKKPGALNAQDEDRADALAESGFVGAVPLETKFSPSQKGQAKNVFTEAQAPAPHHGMKVEGQMTPEAGALAGALAVGHAVRWLNDLRSKSKRKLPVAKAEIEVPEGHKVGMVVPEGGSSCAKCRYVSADLKKCGQPDFQKWNGGDELPAPAEKYCCDFFQASMKKAEGDDVAGKPAVSAEAVPAKRPVESRRYGRNGRGADGKKNPYFNYDDYVPEKLRGRSDRPSGITVHQRGKEVIAQLNGGFGEARAFRRSDGGYTLSYDGLKRAHPIVKQYREHVLRAIGDHVRDAHGAPYFIVPGEGKPN